MDETQRRRQLIDERQTDLARWSNPKQLEPAWEARAVVAADHIAAGLRILDIGCGAMALERRLPIGCVYTPCDVVARDARTIVADLNTQGVPRAAVAAADLVVMLGVWEYLYKPDDAFAAFAAMRKPILCSYCDVGLTPEHDRRRALGWVNDFTLDQFLKLASAQGYRATLTRQIDSVQHLIRFDPGSALPSQPRKSVHVISYNNVGNFGDRLGYHLLNEILPPHADVTWGTLRPFSPVPERADLLVVGIGNSLFGDLLDDRLLEAASNAKSCIGIFGTQYRAQLPTPKLMQLLDRLTHWYARYEEDLFLYGRRPNASHLGDWLINAFPMAVPSVEQTLHIGGGILKDLPMDRTIQHIQRHKRVFSERLHPLLCALTSAEEVAYVEQREQPDRTVASGKFRSMLIDMFGRTFAESMTWKVDRDRVAAYKAKVRRNTDAMRARLGELLA